MSSQEQQELQKQLQIFLQERYDSVRASILGDVATRLQSRAASRLITPQLSCTNSPRRQQGAIACTRGEQQRLSDSTQSLSHATSIQRQSFETCSADLSNSLVWKRLQVDLELDLNQLLAHSRALGEFALHRFYDFVKLLPTALYAMLKHDEEFQFVEERLLECLPRVKNAPLLALTTISAQQRLVLMARGQGAIFQLTRVKVLHVRQPENYLFFQVFRPVCTCDEPIAQMQTRSLYRTNSLIKMLRVNYDNLRENLKSKGFRCNYCGRAFKEDLTQRVFQNFVRIDVFCQQVQREFQLILSEQLYRKCKPLLTTDDTTLAALVYFDVVSEQLTGNAVHNGGNQAIKKYSRLRDFMLVLDLREESLRVAKRVTMSSQQQQIQTPVEQEPSLLQFFIAAKHIFDPQQILHSLYTQMKVAICLQVAYLRGGTLQKATAADVVPKKRILKTDDFQNLFCEKYTQASASPTARQALQSVTRKRRTLHVALLYQENFVVRCVQEFLLERLKHPEGSPFALAIPVSIFPHNAPSDLQCRAILRAENGILLVEGYARLTTTERTLIEQVLLHFIVHDKKTVNVNVSVLILESVLSLEYKQKAAPKAKASDPLYLDKDLAKHLDIVVDLSHDNLRRKNIVVDTCLDDQLLESLASGYPLFESSAQNGVQKDFQPLYHQKQDNEEDEDASKLLLLFLRKMSPGQEQSYLFRVEKLAEAALIVRNTAFGSYDLQAVSRQDVLVAIMVQEMTLMNKRMLSTMGLQCTECLSNLDAFRDYEEKLAALQECASKILNVAGI